MNHGLTLIDAFNQFWTLCENGDRRTLTCVGLTYYYLCNVWNTSGRPISFRRQNTLICAELGISKPTLESHRNKLKQAGLIDFYTKGKGDPNITYEILDARSSKKTLLPNAEKLKNFTSDFTSDFTSGLSYKQSTEIVVEGEVKKFDYLQNLFSAHPGIMYKWSSVGRKQNEFPEAILEFLAQNHGKDYKTNGELIKHFMFWIPNYGRPAAYQPKKEIDPKSVKIVLP